MRADLHLHSNASDGSLSPGAVVAAARAGGLDFIALCDHDTVSGVAAAVREGGERVRVLPAIEISSMLEGRELHLLGYGIDPENAALLQYTSEAASARTERMRRMLAQLAERGINVSYEDVVRTADVPPQCIGRPHLARALQSRGIVRTVSDAFDRFIGNEGPAYVQLELLGPRESIDLVHAAGGIAVWAHPRLDVFDRAVRGLRAQGLDGVECYRPRLTPSEAQYFETAARELAMITTGGSDWHGAWHGPLGDFAINERDLAGLLERFPA